MWLNIGPSWKISNIRTTQVLFFTPKTGRAFLKKRCFVFTVYPQIRWFSSHWAKRYVYAEAAEAGRTYFFVNEWMSPHGLVAAGRVDHLWTAIECKTSVERDAQWGCGVLADARCDASVRLSPIGCCATALQPARARSRGASRPWGGRAAPRRAALRRAALRRAAPSSQSIQRGLTKRLRTGTEGGRRNEKWMDLGKVHCNF